MVRTRNEARWDFPFHHYPSLEHFLAAPAQRGGLTFEHHGRDVDILFEPRGSRTTLVVFNAAVALTNEHTPYFSGQRLAQETGTNLISISEPLLCHKEISVAWYLGDHTTGPLRPILTPAIRHLLSAAQSDRTILFGASGGGYAASHFANDFPGSIALLLNPRLSLERNAAHHLRPYLEHGHGIRSDGSITDEIRSVLTRLGPLNIEETIDTGLNHNILIYQNVLDQNFLKNQLLPFVSKTRNNPQVHIRYAKDKPGHVAMPTDQLHKTVHLLSETKDLNRAIAAAGFHTFTGANYRAVQLMPHIASAHIQVTKQATDQRRRIQRMDREKKHLLFQQGMLSSNIESLTAEYQHLAQSLKSSENQVRFLQTEVKRLKREPKFSRRLWRVLSSKWRQRIKKILHKK